VLAIGQELLKPGLRLRSRIGPGDADGLEAVLARNLPEAGFNLGRTGQKSRSA
jgi:hypothetical protein